MLSKVKDKTYGTKELKQEILNEQSTTSSSWTSVWFTFTKNNWQYLIEFEAKSDTSWLLFNVFDGTNWDDSAIKLPTPLNTYHTLTYTINRNWGESTRDLLAYRNLSTRTYVKNCRAYKINILVTESIKYTPGKPNGLKAIWDLGTITIFWIINNDFFVGVTSNTATTGSITPGNFVGYIKIGNYKIPYYND